MLDGLIGAIVGSLIMLLGQEYWFKKKEKKEKTKKIAGFLVYQLDKFALQCASISQNFDLFFQTKYNDEHGTNSDMGKVEWRIPNLNILLNDIQWDVLDHEDVLSINSISLKTMILQQDIKFLLEDLGEPEDAANRSWEAIVFVGKEAFTISENLKDKYKFILKYSISTEDSIVQMLLKNEQFINSKR